MKDSKAVATMFSTTNSDKNLTTSLQKNAHMHLHITRCVRFQRSPSLLKLCANPFRGLWARVETHAPDQDCPMEINCMTHMKPYVIFSNRHILKKQIKHNTVFHLT